MSEWLDYYRDSRWQEKRLRIMDRDGFKCHDCGSRDTLSVHHSHYESGLMPWEYPDNSLVTLCDSCHKSRHEAQRSMLHASVNRSRLSFEGAKNMVYRFEKTLEEFGIYSDEIIFNTCLEESRRIGAEIDAKIAPIVRKILKKAYGRKASK